MHHRDSHQGNRLSLATKPIVESLERRQMLAGNAFTPSSGDLSNLKSGPLANVGQAGAELYIDYKKFMRKGGDAAQYQPLHGDILSIKDGKLGFSIPYTGSMTAAVNAIKATGAQFIFKGKASRIIDAYIPFSQISSLARDASVVSMIPIYKSITHSVGNADNQGEYGLNADSLRSTFDLTGDGIKIGVISDSVNATGRGLADSYDSGDLPPPSEIDVIDDSTGGTDEGRAMLELIHDIAPKASLAFATDGGSQQTMANNIQRLYEAGCDVIVDDVYKPNEPQFQEGLISAAITSITAKGVVYVTAAGNSGTGGFVSQPNWIESTDGEFRQDWDKDPNHVDTEMLVDISTGTLQLQWDNAYNGIVGEPTVDLDAMLTDPTTGQVIAVADSNNFATGVPTENFSVAPGTYTLIVWVQNRQSGANLPARLALFDIGGVTSFQNLEYKQYSQTASLGHNAAIDALSVAAAPFYETPAYNPDGVIETEDFTSVGPSLSLFKINGQRRSQPKVYLKPDLTSVDNANTSFFGEDVAQDSDKLPNFAGTSAAAPNAAAIAALLLQLAKDRGISYTPDTIKNAMIEAAKQQPVNGGKSGDWDRRGGYGLLDGVTAARILLPDIPSPDIQRVVPQDAPRGVDSLTIKFNEPVNGFDISDLILTRKGVSVFDGNQTLTTTDNQTFVLNGLKKITNRRGTYKLVLDGINITDSNGNTSLGTTEVFYVSGKPTNVVVTSIAPDELNVTWFDNAVGEQSYRVYRSLDAKFSDSKVFDLPADTEKFRDTGLTSATHYYYKVLPVYQDIDIVSSPSSIKDGFTLAKNEIVIDNLSSKGVTVEGDWRSTSEGNKWGLDYIDDKGTGKGDKSVTFTPNIQQSGEYLVFIRWVAGSNRATKVPVTVSDGNGAKSTTTVNQRQETTWKLIGKFVFSKGRKSYVKISTEGTNGIVVADAARFVKADNGDPAPFNPGTEF